MKKNRAPLPQYAAVVVGTKLDHLFHLARVAAMELKTRALALHLLRRGTICSTPPTPVIQTAMERQILSARPRPPRRLSWARPRRRCLSPAPLPEQWVPQFRARRSRALSPVVPARRAPSPSTSPVRHQVRPRPVRAP